MIKQKDTPSISYAHPNIPKLLKELGATESSYNPGLWEHATINKTRTYVDFRDKTGNPNGKRYAFIRCKKQDVNSISWLVEFKKKRDKLLQKDNIMNTNEY